MNAVQLRTLLVLALLLCVSGKALAGSACTHMVAGPKELARAAVAAQSASTDLDRTDAPLALIARVGTDLSEYGLKYSHVGIAVRDHPDGRWTVVHLLNKCGTDRSSVYAEGLVNFFLDDLISQDYKLVWLEPRLAAQLRAELDSDRLPALHEARYNVVARYASQADQNSTSWVLEVLAEALAADDSPSRAAAFRFATAHGYQPGVLRISYGKRLAAGLFSANASFTDHPVADRLSGRYQVVTVKSIFEFLRSNHAVSAELAQPPDRVATE